MIRIRKRKVAREKKMQNPSANTKGLVIVWLPQQNDFRTFCMSDETEKVYRKLEKATSIC